MKISFFRLLLLFFLVGTATAAFSQRINRFRTDEMELIYFGTRYSYMMPHVAGTFHNAMDFHKKFWDYDHSMSYVFLTDFEDTGHGGAMVMPFNTVIIGISPFSYNQGIVPSNERFQWLSNHELTHIVLADKPNRKDIFWRKAMMGKIVRDDQAPVSALWSYLTIPRWYAPRWYHEGIAIFMETWMAGGVGRTLGPYDEMYWRSIVREDLPIYSVVGLETEGTTVDFQVGANSYLYGARFVTYLAKTHGVDKVKDLYNRTDDSKAFYGRQFRQVFDQTVNDAWDDWIDYERKFQQQNLETIREYPLTSFAPITDGPMGSVSRIGYNPGQNKIVAAINHPGIISQFAELDLNTGDVRKIATLDSPRLYSVATLAYDAERDLIFTSEQNGKYRNLVEVDVATGKKRTLIDFSRTGELVFNPADRSIWGVRHDNGYATIVRIPEPYNDIEPMYSTDFGRSIFDLAISSDGKLLSATRTGVAGDQSLLLFRVSDLEVGKREFETLLKLEDNTLNEFSFSNDNKYLIGSSYYTGVSNIWRIHIEDKSFELLSNVETGLFSPQQLSDDSILVLQFFRDGMQPGIIPMEVITSANAIEYKGNLVVDKSPEVLDYSLPPASRIDLEARTTDEAPYRILRNMHLANAYPDIAGYKSSIAVGYRLNWRDRVGISNLNLFVAGSPWTSYEDKQKIHGQLKWNYWNWTLAASYNHTDFYDLFGPTKRSRAGYSVGINYQKINSLRAPFNWHYSFGANHFGDLEVLPDYQNVRTPIKSFQTASAAIGASKIRQSLGGVEGEMGYKWDIRGSSVYANEDFYPSLVSEQHAGFLIPGIRNTSFWIRNSVGQSFGDRQSALSYFYFGGFRNNYVDWRPSSQYRNMLAFPGADIDQIQAHNFVKTMGELNLRPIRMRNVGTTWLYPTFIKMSIFGTHLLVDPDNSPTSRNIFNAGTQVDLELVLLSYLKTTWSVGYARMFESGHGPNEQWMFSVKLLGN